MGGHYGILGGWGVGGQDLDPMGLWGGLGSLWDPVGLCGGGARWGGYGVGGHYGMLWGWGLGGPDGILWGCSGLGSLWDPVGWGEVCGILWGGGGPMRWGAL